MKPRVLIAGLLGGITLFMWGAVSHMVLQLEEKSMKPAPMAPGDQPLLDSVRTALPANGLYYFPGADPEKHMDPQARAEWQERTKTNPHGIIVVSHQPWGGMGGNLGKEIATDIFVALLAAFLLTWTLSCCASFPWRVGFVTLLGVLVSFRPIQLWNWFEFPSAWLTAQVIDGIVGFAVMGVVIALIVKPKPGAPTG